VVTGGILPVVIPSRSEASPGAGNDAATFERTCAMGASDLAYRLRER
jgi:hypothetical protein